MARIRASSRYQPDGSQDSPPNRNADAQRQDKDLTALA